VGDVPGVVFCHTESGLFAFLADIAPDDEMAAVFQEDPDVFSGVIAGIKPKKQGASVRQRQMPMVSARNSGMPF